MIQFKRTSIIIDPTENGSFEFETELDSECGNYCAFVRGFVIVANYKNVADTHTDPGYINFKAFIDTEDLEVDLFTADGDNTDIPIDEDLIAEIIINIEIDF